MGRCHRGDHRRRGDWSCTRRVDRRSRGSCGRRFNRRGYSGDSAARYGPPPPGGFPYARWAGTPGFYYGPYTGRVYDLRGLPPGGLTRDVDTGRLFRKP
ncbi:MAG TPA: hypothetical protein VL136_01575 [Candidatus Babeliales bacterium]|nr:hypothetical protein [Candidatus Babeliales bacterium]